MNDNRSIQEREIIDRILSDDDIVSLSEFLLQKGKEIQYGHNYHLKQWLAVLEKFDDLLNTLSSKISIVDDVKSLSSTLTDIHDSSKSLICSILYFSSILLSSCQGKRHFNLFIHLSRFLKAIDTDIVQLSLTVLYVACCPRSKLTVNENDNERPYEDENWTVDWRKRNIDCKEQVDLPPYLSDDIFTIFEGMNFLAIDYRIADYINGRLPQGISSLSTDITLSYPSNTNNDDNNNSIQLNLPVFGNDNNDIQITMQSILSDKNISSNHSLSLISALRAAEGLRGSLSQRIRISQMKFLCIYIIIYMKLEHHKLDALFLSGGSILKDVISFSDIASEIYSDLDLKESMFSLAALALKCSTILLESRRGKNIGIALDLGVALNGDDQNDSAWTSILFSANVQDDVFHAIVKTESKTITSVGNIQDNSNINTILWSSLTNQHHEHLGSLAYYRIALDFLATVMSQRGHNDSAIFDAPVIGSVINFVESSIPSLTSLLSRFSLNHNSIISKEEIYLVGTIFQAVSCLKLCFRSDNRTTYSIAFRECEGLQTIVKIIELFSTFEYSLLNSLNPAFIVILEFSVSILAESINASRRNARSPADSGMQVLYQTYFTKLCTYVFQAPLKENELLWSGLLKVIKFAISLEPAFLSRFLNSSYSNLFAEALRKDGATLVTSRGGIILPLGELVVDLTITNEGQQFVLSHRIVQLIIESLVKPSSLYQESKGGLTLKKVAHMGKIIAEIMRNFDNIRPIIQSTIQAVVVTVCNECQLQFSDLSLRDPPSESKCSYFNDMNNPRMKVLQKLTNICSFIENLMPDQNRRHYREIQRDILSDEMIKSLLNVYYCVLPYSRQLFAQVSLRSSQSGSSINHYGYYPAAKAVTAVVRIAADLVPHVTLPELLKCIDETLAMISTNKREFSISSGGKEEQIDLLEIGVSEILPKRRRSRGSSLGQQGANVLILGVLDSIPNKCFFDHGFDIIDSSNEIYIWKFMSSILTLEWLSLVLSFCLRTMQRSQGSNNWISGGKEVLRRLFAFYRSSLLEVCRFAATKWIPKPISDCRIKKTLVNSPVLAEFISSEDEEIGEVRMRIPKQYLLRVVDLTEAFFYESFEIEKSRIVAHAEIGITYIAFERKHNGQGTIRYRTAEGWISESRRDHHRDPIVEVIDIPTMESSYSVFESSIPDLVNLEAMTLRESASHAMGRVHGTLKQVAVYLSRLLVGESSGRSFGDMNRSNNISPIAPVLSSSLTKIMSGLLCHPLDCLPESSTPISINLFKPFEDNLKEEQALDKHQSRRYSGLGKGRKHSGYHTKDGISAGGQGKSVSKHSINEEDDDSPKESIEINQAALSLYQGIVMKQILSSIIEDRHGSVNTYLLRAFISGGILESFVDILGIVLATLYDAIDKINGTKCLSVEGRCALYALPHIFSVIRKIVTYDALRNSPNNGSMVGLNDYIGTFDVDDFIYSSFYPIASRILPIFQNHALIGFPADIQQDWLYVVTEMTLNLQTTIIPPPKAGTFTFAATAGSSDGSRSAQDNNLIQRQTQGGASLQTSEFEPENSVIDYFVEMGFNRETVATAIMQIRSNDNEVIMEHLTATPTDSDDADLAAALQLSLSSVPEQQSPADDQTVANLSNATDNLEISAIIPNQEASIVEIISSPVAALSELPVPPQLLPRERSEDIFANMSVPPPSYLPPTESRNLREVPVQTPDLYLRSPYTRSVFRRDAPSQIKSNQIHSIDEVHKKNERLKNLAGLFRASLVSNIIEISNKVGKISEWQQCASSDSMQLICKLVSFLVQMNQVTLNSEEIGSLMSSLVNRLSVLSDFNADSFGILFLLLSILRCSSMRPLLDHCYPLDQEIISNLTRSILSRLRYEDDESANCNSMTWFSTALLVLNELMILPIKNNDSIIVDSKLSDEPKVAANDACKAISNLLKPKKTISKDDYPEIYDVVITMLTDNKLDAEQYQSIMLILSTLLDDQTYVHKFLCENGLQKLLAITVAKAPNMSNSFVSTMLFTKILHNCMDSKTELRGKIKIAIQNFLTGKGIFIPNSMNKTRRSLKFFLTKMTPLLVRYPVDFASVFIATCTICTFRSKENNKDEFYVKINDKDKLLDVFNADDDGEFEGRLEAIVSTLINFIASSRSGNELLFSKSDVLSALSDCIPYAQKVTNTIAKTVVSQTSQNISDYLITSVFANNFDGNDPQHMTFQATCRFLIMLNTHRGSSRKMVIGSVMKYLKQYSSPKPNIIETERIQFLTKLAVLISHMTEVSSKSKNNVSSPHLSLDTLQVLISSGICEISSKAIGSLLLESTSPVKDCDDAIKSLLVPLELIARPKLLPHINRIRDRLCKKERAASFTSTTGSDSKLHEIDSPREVDSPRGIHSNGDEIITMHDIDGDGGRNDSTFNSVALGTSDVMAEEDGDDEEEQDEGDEEEQDEADDDEQDGDDEDDEDDDEDEDDEEEDGGDEVEIMNEDYEDDPRYTEILEDIYNDTIPSRFRNAIPSSRDGQSTARQLLAGVFQAAESVLGGMDNQRNGRGDGGNSNNFITPPDQIRPETSFFASMPRPASFLHRNGLTQHRGIPPRWPSMVDGLESVNSRNSGLERWDYMASRAQTASGNSTDDMYGVDISIPVELIHGQQNITTLHPLLIRADEVNGGPRNLRPLNPSNNGIVTTPNDSRLPDFLRGAVISSNGQIIGYNIGQSNAFENGGLRNVSAPRNVRTSVGLGGYPSIGRLLDESTDNSPNDGLRQAPTDPQGTSQQHTSFIEQVESVLAGLAVPIQSEEVELLWGQPASSSQSADPTAPVNNITSVSSVHTSVSADNSIESPLVDDTIGNNNMPTISPSSHNSVIDDGREPIDLGIDNQVISSGNELSEVLQVNDVSAVSDVSFTTEIENSGASLSDDPVDVNILDVAHEIHVPENVIETNDQSPSYPDENVNNIEVPLEVVEQRIPCPAGYDESVFYALPDFMQQEIVDQQASSTSNEQLQQLAVAAGYDFDTLMSLPENIRQEILDQARRDQAAASGAAVESGSSAGAEDMDNASFLVSLPPNLREEVLLSADSTFMATLPPQLQAEANLLRERSAIQFLNRENAQQQLGNDEEDMPNQRTGERWRQGQSDRRVSSNSSSSKKIEGYMRLPTDDVDETLIPAELLPVVAKLINRGSLDNHAQHLLNKLLTSMCKYPIFRNSILVLFAGLLSEDKDIVNTTITSIMHIGTASKGSSMLIDLFDTEFNLENVKVPCLISNKTHSSNSSNSNIRFILALTIIIAANPSVVYDFLRSRVERYGSFEMEASGKKQDMRRKALTSTSEQESSNSLLEVIIGLFGKRQWKDKSSDLLVLSTFVSAVTDQLDNLKDEPTSGEISTSPESGTVAIPRVILSKYSLGCLCEVLISDNCTQQIFDNITLVISRLSHIENNNIHLTNLIVDVAQDLAEQSEAKLNQFLRILGNQTEKDNGNKSDSKVAKSNSLPLSEAGGRQHERMLRVIQTLNSMAQRTNSSILAVIPCENFSSIWSALEKVLTRLQDFMEDDDASVGTTRKPQTALSSILSRLLPAIETFFIINACDIFKDKKDNESSSNSPNKSPEVESAQKTAEPEKLTIDEVLRKATTNLVFPGEKYRQSEAYRLVNISLYDTDGGNIDSTRLQKSRSIRLVLSGLSQSVLSSRSQRLLAFVHNHKSILNLLISTKPQMLDGSLSSLIRVPQLRSYLEFENKRKYFFNELRMERSRGNIHLNLRRDQVYLDSFHQLRMRTADEMRGTLRVNFQGEEGVDAGGLTREWYVVISKEIFNAHYGLFVSLDGGSTFQPSSFSGQWNNNHLDYFKFIGRVIGKAICDGHLMDAHFTKSFYKHVLGIPVDYTDIEAIDPIYYKNLKLILTTPLEDMGLDLTFSAEENTFGQNKVFDLIPNGRNIEVTDDTKHDYVRLLAHHMMTRAIRAQIESFLDGFYDLVPPELITIFTPTELELLICGLPDVNIEDLHQHTDYRQYRENDLIIIWFWDILRSFSREERALFLQFVTGTSKVPLGGFANLQGMRGTQQFSIHRAYVDVGLLPTAHTCYNQLDLPFYGSQEDLREKLLMAIKEGNEGFGFA